MMIGFAQVAQKTGGAGRFGVYFRLYLYAMAEESDETDQLAVFKV